MTSKLYLEVNFFFKKVFLDSIIKEAKIYLRKKAELCNLKIKNGFQIT